MDIQLYVHQHLKTDMTMPIITTFSGSRKQLGEDLNSILFLVHKASMLTIMP